MDFEIPQAAIELAGLTRQILGDLATPERLGQVEGGFDPDMYAALAKAEVLAAALPESAGGAGYGLAEQAAVLTEIGRAVAPVPYLASIVLGASAICEFGSAAQIARWAAPAGAGTLVLTAALSDGEPAVPAGARPEGDGWRLSGVKTAVPFGAMADVFLVPAVTPQGTAVFVLDRSDPGVTVRPQQVTGGAGAAGAALVEFTEVLLNSGRLLGDAWSDSAVRHDVAAWLVDRALVGLCATQLGVAERALELTAEYARKREQFGKPIGAFQAVAQRLADAYIDVAAIRLTMWQAAWLLAEGAECGTEVATAKFWAADAGHRVAHTAVHIHGGVGIDTDYPLHRYFLAAKQNEFELGGATTQLRRIGSALAQTAFAE